MDSNSGSSPLSRGIRVAVCQLLPHRRIIPALAGNTNVQPACDIGLRDHPRSRGEYGNQVYLTHHEAGSSPLSRGILKAWVETTVKARIIPALAGNTHTRMDPSHSAPDHPALAGNTIQMSHYEVAPEDHPRSRGEYDYLIGTFKGVYGSSPLSRGIQTAFMYDGVLRGIIPALAGNTIRPRSFSATARDHPRSRGEYKAIHRCSQ